ETIEVHAATTQGFPQRVAVNDVLTESVLSRLQKTLQEKMPTREVADRAFAWFKPKLPITLKLNIEATQAQQDNAAKAIPMHTEVYPAGRVLAHARDDKGQPLPIDDTTVGLLRLEHQAELDEQPLTSKFARSLAVCGMYVALYVLCGFYIWLREPR